MTPPIKQLRYLSSTAILRGQESVIGRSDYSSVIIPHPSVSRLHATIFHRDGETFIKDLGSRNGTFVNGRPVHEEPVAIDIGDKVEIGTVACMVESAVDNACATTDIKPNQEDDDTAPLSTKREPA